VPPVQLPRLVLLSALATLSCVRLTEAQRQEALQRSLAAIDPNAEPLPPKEPPADGPPELNTEYWLGGSEQAEQSLITDFGTQIQALQKAAAEAHGTAVFRGFHAKSHGCLHGELRPLEGRPARTRFGIFAEGAQALPVWVRFSNGVGWKQSDSELDARGMAIKVMGVQGKKYLDDEQSTQDFLMTNSPVPVGKDAIEFMDFAHANAKGRLAGIFFLLGHPRTGSALTKTGAIDSAVTATYWSGGPYHLGAHQAIKYIARPCDANLKREPKRDSPDYLREDLTDAAKADVCFRFYVQFQADAEETPIENSSIRWDEELSVPVPVAEVVMPAQELAATDFCDGLAFTPWHAIAAHKPMGTHNRARRTVYQASQLARATNGEPQPWQPDGTHAAK
jgi:hypothetical protein